MAVPAVVPNCKQNDERSRVFVNSSLHPHIPHKTFQEEFVNEVLKRHSRITFFFKIILKVLSPLMFPFIGVPASQLSLGDGGDLFLG